MRRSGAIATWWLAGLAVTWLLIGAVGASATTEHSSWPIWDLGELNPGNLCQTQGICSSHGEGYDVAHRAPIDAGAAGGYEGARGNSLSFTDDGQTLIAAAFSTTGASGALETAFLGNNSPGLGVLNEDARDRHTVGNRRGTDMVIFFFDSDGFLPEATFLSNFGDSDVTLLVGGTAADFSAGGDPFAGFAGLTLADLEAGGFARRDDSDDGTGSDRSVDFDLGSGRYAIVAAQVGQIDEAFKIRSLEGHSSGNPPNGVPEPMGLAAFGLGMAALCMRVRRSRSR